MLDIRDCYKYSGSIKKLTKANSTVVGKRIIYIVKKDHNQKATKIYVAYDYKTGIQLAFHKDKDYLIGYLNKREKDLGVLDE